MADSDPGVVGKHGRDAMDKRACMTSLFHLQTSSTDCASGGNNGLCLAMLSMRCEYSFPGKSPLDNELTFFFYSTIAYFSLCFQYGDVVADGPSNRDGFYEHDRGISALLRLS